MVLDAGCGRGVISRAMARNYPSAQIEAIDCDHSTQERNQHIAEKAGIRNCIFEVDDLNNLYREKRYDLIVSVDNLEHIKDDKKVIRNLFESMQPGGKLLIHVPHYYRRWPLLNWKVNFDVPGHVRPGYHLPELTERVKAAGFEIHKCGFSYGFLENLANNVSYWITGAEERNQILYGLAFPFLNAIAWMGQWSKPSFGAGTWVIATRPA
jgi:cyclopropane fatty-acyl-phospholipid synthase-like methyltransferase